MNVYLCFLDCLHFSIGHHHRCGGSWISAGSPSELSCFLLSMFIDATGWPTNSRSSGDFEVGAGVVLASMGEFNVALSVFLGLQTFFARSHATLRAHISWCKVPPYTDCARDPQLLDGYVHFHLKEISARNPASFPRGLSQLRPELFEKIVRSVCAFAFGAGEDYCPSCLWSRLFPDDGS